MTLVIGLLLFSSSVLVAQGPVGSITGTAHDATGAVLPEVTVTLTSPALISRSRAITTDERGYYNFFDLKPGLYTLRFERPGFKTLTREGILVSSAFQVTVHAELPVGPVTEGITVTGASPGIDRINAVSQTALDQSIIEGIPNARDPWVLARMVPGVQAGRFDVGGTESMQQYTLTIHGSRDSDKTFAIDGVEVNWTGGTGGGTALYYNAGMLSELNYQTGALPAEISQGGVYMNMVTKDGGNEIHGGLLFFGADDRFQGNNLTPELRDKLLADLPEQFHRPDLRAGNPIRHIYDFNAHAGGPIIKDRLWWFGSFRQWSVDQLVSGAFNADGGQAIDDNLIRNGLGKMTWQIDPKNRFSFMYNCNQKYRYHRRDTPPYFIEDKASWRQPAPAYSMHLKWTNTPTRRWVIDSGLAYVHNLSPLHYQPDVKPTDILREDVTRSTRSNASPYDRVSPMYRLSADASASYVASAWGGPHSLKFGIQCLHSSFRQISKINGDIGQFFDDGVPSYVVVYNTPINQANYLHQWAGYVQDAWTIRPRVTLNLGLRYEYALGVIPAQQSAAGTFVGERHFLEIRDVPNFKNWAPRLGLAWDITGRGKTVVKASASRYLQNFGMNLITAVNPLGLSSDKRTWDGRVIGPGTGFVGGQTTRMDPHLQRPYAWEYSVGLQQEVFQGLVLAVTGWHRDHRRQIGRANLSVPPAAYISVPITNPLTNQPLTIYNQDPATRGRVDNLLTNFKELDSRYNGVDITFTKRFSQRWQLLGGLTIGRERGAFRGDLVNGFDDLYNPNFNLNRQGIVGNDATYQFKMAGTYPLPWGFELSGNFQHFTGYPLRRIYNVTRVQVPNLTQVNQAVDLMPRGAVRLPGVHLLDLRIARTFRLAERWTIQPALDVYNLGNVNTTTAQVETVGAALDQPAVILAPRLFKLGVKVGF